MKFDPPHRWPIPARPAWQALLSVVAVVVVLAGCDDARTPGAAAAPAGSATPPTAPEVAGSGTGVAPGSTGFIEFSLGRGGVAARLPVTLCAGFGAVLTVVGIEGEAQVEVQVIESPVMRGDLPLAQATTSGYRRTGVADGRRYQEIWTSHRNQSVVREDRLTRVTGTMTGQRMEAIDDTRFGPPMTIDGQRELPYTLTARCAS